MEKWKEIKWKAKKSNGNLGIEKESDRMKNITGWDQKNRDDRKRINGYEDTSIENFQFERRRKSIFRKINRASGICGLITKGLTVMSPGSLKEEESIALKKDLKM